MTLGIANGVALGAFLLVILRFFQTAAPHLGNWPFALYTLAGGLGGIVFAVSLAFSWHDSPPFETQFWPLFGYELLEGPYLSPILYGPRLYYTVALALCFGSLTAYLTALRISCSTHRAFALFLLLCAAFLNPRFAGFTVLALLLYLIAAAQPLRRAIGDSAALAVVLAVGAIASYAMMFRSPSFVENTGLLVRESMLITPFITASIFLLALAAPVAWRHSGEMDGLARVIGYAALGYLAAFAVLFVAHQLYYLNAPGVGEAHAAIVVSDLALIGAVVAPAFSRRRRALKSANSPEEQWWALWLLVFVAVALSAFGQGWLLQFTPQRMMVFAGPPLALLAAAGIRSPATKGLAAVAIGCGITSIIAGVLFFQGPLLQQPGVGPFARFHPEFMLADDAALIDAVPPGTVLAPYEFADLIAVRRADLSVLGGVGATDLSDQRSVELQPQIDAFFQPGMTPIERLAFIDRWCVTSIVLPATWPAAEEVAAELRAMTSLESLEFGAAVLLVVEQ